MVCLTLRRESFSNCNFDREIEPLRWSLVSCLSLMIILALWCYTVIVPYSSTLAMSGPFGGDTVALDWKHPLGVDPFGRDVLEQCVYGIAAWSGSGLLGGAATILGGVLLSCRHATAPSPPRIERWVCRFITALPSLAWVMVASILSQQHVGLMAFTFGATKVPGCALELRSAFAQLQRDGFVEGALGHRLPYPYVLRHHLFFLEGGSILWRAAVVSFVGFIFTEAALSYMGDLGIQEPTPSVGRLLRDLSPALFQASHGTSVLPALAIIAVFLTLTTSLLKLGSVTPGAAWRNSRLHRLALSDSGSKANYKGDSLAGISESEAPGLGDGAIRGFRPGGIPGAGHSGISRISDRPVANIEVAGGPGVMSSIPHESYAVRWRISVQDMRLGDAQQKPLLQFSLEVFSGEVTAIVGASGSGKSLLLKAILGALPPGVVRKSGTVIVAEAWDSCATSAPISALPPGFAAWMDQDPARCFDPAVSLKQQIRESLLSRGTLAEVVESRLQLCCREVAISPDILERSVQTLSGGQLRRILVAWILATGAPFLFADEPSSGIDPIELMDLLDLLRQAARLGRGVIMVTHELRWIAAAADRVVILSEGNVVAEGRPAEILEDTDRAGHRSGASHAMVSRLLSARAALRNRRVCQHDDSMTKKTEAMRSDGDGFLVRHVDSRVPLISLTNVTASYDSHGDKPLLSNINVTLRAGESIGIIGSNGAGKSLLGRVLAGLIAPHSGTINILERSGIQFLGQSAATCCHPKRRVREAIIETLRFHGHRYSGFESAPDCASKLLRAMRLHAKLDCFPAQLSGGEKRRLGLLRLLLARPKMMIMDEPTEGMDVISIVEVLDLLAQYSDPAAIQIWISHDLDVLRVSCQRIMQLETGRVVATMETCHWDSPDLSSPISRWMAAWKRATL